MLAAAQLRFKFRFKLTLIVDIAVQLALIMRLEHEFALDQVFDCP